MINRLLEWDVKISQKLRLKEEQTILKKIASLLAHSGDSWYIEIVLFCIWVFSKGRLHTVSAFFAGAVIIQALFVIGLKFLIKRQRPQGEWGEVYRNTDPHSFPSGHAARAIMLAVLACGFSLPVIGSAILIWGLLLSFARVSLGVHYFIDILVGWIIGILLGVFMLSSQQFFMDLIPIVF